MDSRISDKLNQNNFSLIIEDALKRVRLLFTVERIIWLALLIYFSIFSFLGLHLIRHHFGQFMIRLLFPWVIAFLYFNVSLEGIPYLLSMALIVILSIVWSLFWIIELLTLCKGEYRIWEADKWEDDENDYDYLFSAKTSWILTSLVILFYQFVYLHYTSIPFLTEISDGIIHLYSFLPVY